MTKDEEFEVPLLEMTRPDGPTGQNKNQHKLNTQAKTFQGLKNINSITSYNDLTQKIKPHQTIKIKPITPVNDTTLQNIPTTPVNDPTFQLTTTTPVNDPIFKLTSTTLFILKFIK